MFRIETPGLQSTLQGAPRVGHRHFGIPYAGPADPLSMALANRLVDNALDATCLEIAYGGFEAAIEAAVTIAVTGAGDDVLISGQRAPMHESLELQAGDQLVIPPMRHGVRTYLAVASGFQAWSHFGSCSTYLPGKFGGHEGRALIAGDRLAPHADALVVPKQITPETLRPHLGDTYALRATVSAETDLLLPEALDMLFQASFTVGRQATRMGLSLDGPMIIPHSDGMMESAPVFPGTIQAPPSGHPIILLCDAQTTGGYPRVASIARCDQHLLGQARPGDQIQLLRRSFEQALHEDRDKRALFAAWFARD
ncbi:MAG: biotin-dependent carboxyltransferase family protein [Pseudomonadota bacterium]